MTIFAQKGEIVTCPNGHPVFEVVQELERGGRVGAASFKSVVEGIADPVKNERITGCPECGRAFHQYSWKGPLQFHFEDGWRP